MALTQAEKDGLGVALNEASFLDVDVSSIDDGLAVAILRALSWDDDSDEPAYPVVHLALSGVSRLAASLRDGVWNDQDAPVHAMHIGDVSPSIRAMGASDLYGWEYIDAEPAEWRHWSERLSLDHQTPHPAPSHHVHLFKEQFQPVKTLDLRIWFEGLSVTTQAGDQLGLDEFIERGTRWWDAMYAGDERTAAVGIVRGTTAPGDRQ